MILGTGRIIQQINRKCCFSVYFDPFDKKVGNSWFHAADGKPGYHGISMFLVIGWYSQLKIKKKKWEIHNSKYLKEQMIFSQRQYCNICPVQWPINSNRSGQDCSILLHHFGEASKCETTRISVQLTHCLLKWIKFCNFRIFWNRAFFFWKSSKQHKHGFRVIISVGSPYQTFSS